MRLSLARRIKAENVPPEMQDTMNNLAIIMNPFIEDVTTILNGRIDFDNLAFPIRQFEIIVNDKGIPLFGDLDINFQIRGHNVINVQDANNINTIPEVTKVPFILFTQSNQGTMKIAKVLNLLPNRKYLLTVIFY